MNELKNQLLFIALMAIGSYTATTLSAQSAATAINQVTHNVANQAEDNVVCATKAKTMLPF